MQRMGEVEPEIPCRDTDPLPRVGHGVHLCSWVNTEVMEHIRGHVVHWRLCSTLEVMEYTRGYGVH